ncbi:MAG: TrkA family potassium uptake protein [Oscillospiraceae bacterium]
MNILVVGCGKVGSRLASQLAREGHDISVIDKSESSFELLDDDFVGFKTAGIPIDQDVLKRAGIENCDAVAAVSQDDNINIMVSQLAHNVFHVPNVLARIYDPRREDVFSHFGLHTVCPTNLTVSAVRSAIVDNDDAQMIYFNAHTVSFKTEEIEKNMIGMCVSEVSLNENQSIFGVMRNESKILLNKSEPIVLQENDKLIIGNVI